MTDNLNFMCKKMAKKNQYKFRCLYLLVEQMFKKDNTAFYYYGEKER